MWGSRSLPSRQHRLLKLDHTSFRWQKKLDGYFQTMLLQEMQRRLSCYIKVQIQNWNPGTTHVFAVSNRKYLDCQNMAHQPNIFENITHGPNWVTGYRSATGRISFCHRKKTRMTGFIYNLPFHLLSMCHAHIYHHVKLTGCYLQNLQRRWVLKWDTSNEIVFLSL